MAVAEDGAVGQASSLSMEVVLEVNWMLAVSWLESGAEGVGGGAWEEELRARSVKGVVAREGVKSMRLEALSMRTM